MRQAEYDRAQGRTPVNVGAEPVRAMVPAQLTAALQKVAADVSLELPTQVQATHGEMAEAVVSRGSSSTETTTLPGIFVEGGRSQSLSEHWTRRANAFLQLRTIDLSVEQERAFGQELGRRFDFEFGEMMSEGLLALNELAELVALAPAGTFASAPEPVSGTLGFLNSPGYGWNFVCGPLPTNRLPNGELFTGTPAEFYRRAQGQIFWGGIENSLSQGYVASHAAGVSFLVPVGVSATGLTGVSAGVATVGSEAALGVGSGSIMRMGAGQNVTATTMLFDGATGVAFSAPALIALRNVPTSVAGVAAERGALSIEAQFQANSLRLADEGHGIFTQGVANGDIVLNPRLSMEIQRGSFVDGYIRRGNLALRSELGLDATTVRINQRLYAPNGRYSVPDLHFPLSGNSLDYSYQLKNATTSQIMRIQQAAPNGTITIVPPAAIRPVYTIRP